MTNDLGEPRFLVGGIPPNVTDLPPITRPEIYIGEDMTGYSIVGTKQTELSTDNVQADYAGGAGVPIDSTTRRAAFALRFGEIEPLISDSITGDSKVIYNRDVVDRVKQVAPFLETDPDPYPVLVGGRVQYIVDAYTTSMDYPYSQRVDAAAVDEGSSGTFNYLRNSAKALVDAYDGTVTLYLTDELYGAEDPIIRAYAEAFPKLFTEEIPDEVAAHFRYPEFQFKTQTLVWGRYHQSDPSTFFNNSDRWIVAPRPSDVGGSAATEEGSGSNDGPIEPYYQEMKIGSAESSQFVLTRPFVLSSGDGTGRNLTSIMVARNDGDDYGKLEQVVMVTETDGEVERNNEVDGPVRANRNMVTYGPVVEYQTLVDQAGSRVRFGNILQLPLGDALMYLRPIYAADSSSSKFNLKKVVVSSGVTVGFGDTIEQAVDDLLDGDPDGAVDQLPTDDADPTDPGEGGPTTTTVPGEETLTATELLTQADELFTEANARLADQDLAGYQRLVDEAVALLRRANSELAGAVAPASATTTVPADGGTTTTTEAPPG